MSDPLDALRAAVEPVHPEPRFAADLRARLERALLEPTGGIAMSPAAATPAAALPQRSLTPYLAVEDARQALEFYVRAFGAQRRGEPIVMDDGRIGHAEVAIGDSVLMLADESAASDMLSPHTRGGPSQTLLLQVEDVDAALARAVQAGARVTRPVADYSHGRNAVVHDPFGHRWMISAAPRPEPQGEVGYCSLWVADVDRAATFFEAALGWSSSGTSEHRLVENTTPHHGIVQFESLPRGLWDPWPRHNTLFLSHAVVDVDATVARIRAAGGQCTTPTDQPYGRAANCIDDQGMPFAIHQQPAGAGPGAAAAHSRLAYVTFEVVDTGRARAFFGAVFGWRFTPGHVPDGWQIEGLHPMGGMRGGHSRPTIVPMYAVDDVHAVVQRVRAAGGTASEPEQQSYGITATCTDEQGTRFYLGELTG
jgi:uncharacterized glyoxalase superfamily protein PhnB